MATTTSFLGLQKPAYADSADVAVINSNMDVLDGAVARSRAAGIVYAYAGATAPSGYLLCQGQAVSRTTYAALFMAIGTTFGTGDGSTTFNVPDLQGRVAIGSSSAYSLGAKGGASTVTLTSAQSGVPAHAHGLNSHKHSIPEHGHGHSLTLPNHGHTVTKAWRIAPKITSGGTAMFANGTGAGIHGYLEDMDGLVGAVSSYPSISGSVSNKAAFDTAAATGNTANNSASDASSAHNNMQPYQVLNYIISTGE